MLTYPANAELGRYVADQIPDAERAESRRATLRYRAYVDNVLGARPEGLDGSTFATRTGAHDCSLHRSRRLDSEGSRAGPTLARAAAHNRRIRRELARYSGREIDTAGDGFFASGFDGPARAIRCACAIRDAIHDLGLHIRVGVYTGECDVVDGKLAGLAVVVGSRIAAQADEGDVVVSGTVRDLVAGLGIEFESRGTRRLKGVGDWPLVPVRAATVQV